MALTNISQGLQTQFSGVTILMVSGIAPRIPIHHGGTKAGTTPAYRFPFRTPAAALCFSLGGVHPIFPTLWNPGPALMESHPSLQLLPEVQMLNREFNFNLSHLIQFFDTSYFSFLFYDLSYRSIVYYPLISTSSEVNMTIKSNDIFLTYNLVQSIDFLTNLKINLSMSHFILNFDISFPT